MTNTGYGVHVCIVVEANRKYSVLYFKLSIEHEAKLRFSRQPLPQDQRPQEAMIALNIRETVS